MPQKKLLCEISEVSIFFKLSIYKLVELACKYKLLKNTDIVNFDDKFIGINLGR